jgi:hypothetical protein
MNKTNSILLSLDVEEFDMPVAYGHLMSTDEQLRACYEGLITIRNLLEYHHITSTFFTTANFASHYPAIIRSLSADHEIGSHTFYHSSFEPTHLSGSKKFLEYITGQKVTGLRMPRMKIISPVDIAEAGYSYDASINPVWLPGRYNNLLKPRTVFTEESITRIPASASRFLRIPFFWLSFKNLPYSLYLRLILKTLRHDGYLSLYFHPWEFIDLKKYKMPGYTKNPSGDALLKRFERLIADLKNEGNFLRMDSFAAQYNSAGRTITAVDDLSLQYGSVAGTDRNI